jgi:D-alanyl-lipoteichoic acid acyltransferase DltB (MBOAT superfamily)
MSKPTDSFWRGLGWCFIWLGLLGGIALIIHQQHSNGDSKAEVICVQQHGTWTYEQGYYYTCIYKK